MGSASMNAKKRDKKERLERRSKKKKGIEVQRLKPPTQPCQLMSSWVTKNRKETKNKKKKEETGKGLEETRNIRNTRVRMS